MMNENGKSSQLEKDISEMIGTDVDKIKHSEQEIERANKLAIKLFIKPKLKLFIVSRIEVELVYSEIFFNTCVENLIPFIVKNNYDEKLNSKMNKINDNYHFSHNDEEWVIRECNEFSLTKFRIIVDGIESIHMYMTLNDYKKVIEQLSYDISEKKVFPLVTENDISYISNYDIVKIEKSKTVKSDIERALNRYVEFTYGKMVHIALDYDTIDNIDISQSDVEMISTIFPDFKDIMKNKPTK